MPGTARDKINSAAIVGAALVAGAIALLAQSWGAFLFTFVLLLITSFMAGDLRTPPKRDNHRRNQ